MKCRKPLKIILVVVLVAALLGGGTFGALRLARNSGGEVNVYPVSSFSARGSDMDMGETQGMVTLDRIQTVYLSSTQQVTEIFVEEGQTIHAGDPIVAFDTTLDDLALERQEIRIRQLKLDIQKAEDRLKEIATYRVGSPTVYVPVYEPPAYNPSPYMPYDRAPQATGTYSDPLIWLWNDDCLLDEAFFLRIAAIAAANREAAREASNEPVDEPTDEPPEETEEPLETDAPEETNPPAETAPPAETDAPAETEPPAEAEPEPEPEPEPASEPSADDAGEGESAAAPMGRNRMLSPSRTPLRLMTADELPAPADGPEEVIGDASSELDDPNLYIVFEVRAEDDEEGDLIRAWEMVLWIDRETADWTARFIEPLYDPGQSSYDFTDYSDYYVDTNVYYSASEIAKMKADTNKQLKDLTIQLKAAEVEYDRIEYELTNGQVLSKIDGVVKTVRDPEEALRDNKPMTVISGGGGYYVTAGLGELDLASMQTGDSVTVMSWETGQMLEGTVAEVSEYPDESGQYWFYSQGNRNVSTYPFKVFIDENAELREGEYVSIQYNTGSGGGGLYLENPFIRQENGKSFVYTVGADGLLEKRYIRTGRSMWGSYTEILSGLRQDSFVAFPYGRQTKDGAQVRYADADELWAAAYGIG